jgi:hypothetical protein
MTIQNGFVFHPSRHAPRRWNEHGKPLASHDPACLSRWHRNFSAAPRADA